MVNAVKSYDVKNNWVILPQQQQASNGCDW